MEMRARKIRVLLGKVGLDCHDRGVRVLARMLMEAGMEVIYLGLFQNPERIVETALQEDTDVVGISTLCNEHNVFVPEIAEGLDRATERREGGLPLLLVGGIIPPDDVARLKEIGVDAVFPAGSLVEEIVSYIRTEVQRRSGRDGMEKVQGGKMR